MKKGIILAVAVMIIIAVALIFSPKAEEISLYDAILRDIEDFYGLPAENVQWTGAIFPFDSNIEKDFADKAAEMMKEYDYVVGITKNHAEILSQNYPEYKEKIFAFPCEVSDPYAWFYHLSCCDEPANRH